MTPFTATLCTVAAEPEGASTPMRRSGESGAWARNRATRSGVGGTMGSPSLQRRSSNTAFTSSNPPTATMSPGLRTLARGGGGHRRGEVPDDVGERHRANPLRELLVHSAHRRDPGYARWAVRQCRARGRRSSPGR